MKQYFLVDVETGGLRPGIFSLLTVYGVILSHPSLEVVAEIDLQIKPDSGGYHVSAKALEINKINLVEHDKTAITETEAKTRLIQFFVDHSDPKSKLVPTGHNVHLDVAFLKLLLGVETCEKYFGHRHLDTSSLAHLFQILEKIPESNNGSLPQLCEHFGVDTTDLHTASADVNMTHKLLQKFIGSLKV